jgi:hypothetical protein
MSSALLPSANGHPRAWSCGSKVERGTSCHRHRILLSPRETACAEAPLRILDLYFETVVNLFTGLSTPSLVPSGRAEPTV